MRTWKKIKVRKQDMPHCDICNLNQVQTPATYDAPMAGGLPWANLCRTHMEALVSPNCCVGFERVIDK